MTSTLISAQGAVVILAVLAKATLLLVVALAIAAVLRRAPAGARHLVWVAVLASVLVLPAVARWAPVHLAVLPATFAEMVPAAAPTVSRKQPDATPTRDAPPASVASEASMAPASAGAASNAPSITNDGRQASGDSTSSWWGGVSWWMIALGTWLAVAGGLLLWLAYGAWSVRRIVRDASPLTGSGWTDALYEAADRLDLEQAPRLVSSDRVEMPFACGLVQPTIVLPASAASWGDDLRRTVLFHELAHVRRRDLVGHTLGRFACALYWFHPLVWTAAKRLRAESERACDDLVLSCGARASDYAEHLLRMVIGVRRHGAPALALPMARRKEFEGRVVAILDPAIRRQAPGRWQAAGVVGVLAVLCLTIAAVAPTTRAAASSLVVEGAPPPSSHDTSARGVDGRERVELPRAPASTSETRERGARVVSSQTSTRTATRTETQMAESSSLSRVVSSAVDAGVKSAAPVIGQTLDAVTRMFVTKGLGGFAQRSDTEPNGGLSPRDRVSLLLKLAGTDDDASVRRTAVWALADALGGGSGRKRSLGADAEIERTLIDALRSDESDDVREMAAWALGETNTRDGLGALAAAARRDKSEDVRETSVWALAQNDASNMMDVFEAAMGDESADVRATAIWAIGTVVPKSAPRGLVKALDDESEDVRLKAAWALGQIVDPSTGDALVAAFKREQKSEVKTAELRALAFLGEQSRSVLDAALASNDADLRARAVQILAGRGPGVWPWPWPWPRPRPMP